VAGKIGLKEGFRLKVKKFSGSILKLKPNKSANKLKSIILRNVDDFNFTLSIDF
jgi:hypothetical protein